MCAPYRQRKSYIAQVDFICLMIYKIYKQSCIEF